MPEKKNKKKSLVDATCVLTAKVVYEKHKRHQLINCFHADTTINLSSYGGGRWRRTLPILRAADKQLFDEIILNFGHETLNFVPQIDAKKLENAVIDFFKTELRPCKLLFDCNAPFCPLSAGSKDCRVFRERSPARPTAASATQTQCFDSIKNKVE